MRTDADDGAVDADGANFVDPDPTVPDFAPFPTFTAMMQFLLQVVGKLTKEQFELVGRLVRDVRFRGDDWLSWKTIKKLRRTLPLMPTRELRVRRVLQLRAARSHACVRQVEGTAAIGYMIDTNRWLQRQLVDPTVMQRAHFVPRKSARSGRSRAAALTRALHNIDHQQRNAYDGLFLRRNPVFGLTCAWCGAPPLVVRFPGGVRAPR